MTITQLKAIPPGLQPVSLLATTPALLTAKYGLKFQVVRDDLDELTWAAIELEGQPFALLRYARSPEPGTELWGRVPGVLVARELDLLESWRAPEEDLAEGSFELLHPRGQGGKFRETVSRLGFRVDSLPKQEIQRRSTDAGGTPRPGGGRSAPSIGDYHRSLLPQALLGADGRTIAGQSVPPKMVKAPEDHPARKKFGGAYEVLVPEEGERDGMIGVGVDAKGRVKREYTDAFKDGKGRDKFARVSRLVDGLAGLDEKLRADAGKNDVADALLLIRATALRPGDTRDRGGRVEAFGASTLQAQHVIEEDDVMRLRFVGKGGKAIDVPVQDPDVQEMLRGRVAAADAPDAGLFPGAAPQKMNAYLKDAAGGADFKVKDLRTVLATTMARDLAKGQSPGTKTEARKARSEIAKAVSAQLGNTPAVALSSYVNPDVFGGWPL